MAQVRGLNAPCRIQSDDPISRYEKLVELTIELAYHAISMVRSPGFLHDRINGLSLQVNREFNFHRCLQFSVCKHAAYIVCNSQRWFQSPCLCKYAA